MIWLLTAIGVVETAFAVGFAFVFAQVIGGADWIVWALVLLGLRWGARGMGLTLAEDFADRLTRTYRQAFLAQRLAAADPWYSPADAVVVEAAAERIGREQALVKPIVLGLIPSSLIVVAGMATVSWYLAILLLATLPLVVLFLILLGSRTAARGRDQISTLERLGALVLDRLQALPELWLAGNLVNQRGLLERASQHHQKSTFSLLKVAFLSGAAVDLLASLSIALIAVQVGVALLNLIEMGDLAGVGLPGGLFLLMLAPELYLPWRRLVAVWHDRNQAKSAQEKLDAWSQLTPETFNAGLPLPDLSPGARVWLSGPSGSGKSRWLNQLAGLSGGAAVTTRLGWVEQHPWFESQALSDLAASVNCSATELLSHVHSLGLQSRIPSSDTWLAPEQLSGGERARLSVAVALARNPEVLLLDEPTASLDLASRQQFWEILSALSVPMVVASHDDLSDWASAVVRL